MAFVLLLYENTFIDSVASRTTLSCERQRPELWCSSKFVNGARIILRANSNPVNSGCQKTSYSLAWHSPPPSIDCDLCDRTFAFRHQHQRTELMYRWCVICSGSSQMKLVANNVRLHVNILLLATSSAASNRVYVTLSHNRPDLISLRVFSVRTAWASMGAGDDKSNWNLCRLRIKTILITRPA